MTKTQYYTATSVDGFIADQRNSLDWLFESGARRAERHFESFFSAVGAFAMGATTYEWAVGQHDLLARPERWRDWYGDVPCWVFTHRDLAALPGADITFVRGDVRPVHEAMVAAANGRNVWVTGGGELAGAFADHGLLDEVILSVAPVMLGGGAPLLPRRLLSSRLSLVDVRRDDQFVYLTYRLAADG